MPLIAVINKSTLVKDADLQTMCQAIQLQLDLHFCPAWNLKGATITFYADEAKVPGHAWLFSMIDNDASVPGALGYHTLNQKGQVQAFIMAEPILSNQGVVLYDPANASNYSVSGCLSHEVLEALGDRFCDFWFSNGANLYALEVCDPVENDNVVVNVGTQSVFVSNFIFPSWGNPDATSANLPFDFCKKLTTGFSMDPGGYMVMGTSMSNVKQVFGEQMPEWRRKQKSSSVSRGSRRVGPKKSVWARIVQWLKS
jgi:hypothetical protein